MIGKPYLIGGVAVLFALMSWRLLHTQKRVGELEAKLETQVGETIEAANANDSNLTTITTLQERMDIMIAQRRVDAEERERMMDERDQALRRVRMEADRLREEREDEIIDNPDCAELSALRVSDFCPATGGQLRRRSRGAGGDGDEDSR